MYMTVYVFIYVGALGGQERVSDPLKLDFQAEVGPLVRVLGLEPRSSGRAT